MRTLIFFLSAALLSGGLHGLARHLSLSSALATVAFISFWLAISSFNIWFGITKAGYPLAEEWPIFVLIFGMPTLAAMLLQCLLGK